MVKSNVASRIVRASILVAFAVLLTVALSGCVPGLGSRQKPVKTDVTYSPDGSKILFVSTADGDADIYVANADGTNPQKLTNNNKVDASPHWSPDGKKIIFVSDRSGAFEIYTMDPNGKNQTLIPVHLGQ